MAETQHTPGPWLCEHEAGPTNTEGAIASTGVWSQAKYTAALESEEGDDPMDVAWICGIWGDLSPEDFANARLIAAAPDMLAALKGILTANVDGKNVERYLDAIDAARDAVAKAEAR